ncbi:MAG: hypothetical protein L3J95_00725 [Thermoplasmata archaeon]|nr:hypothetical protein [Thermoplasmata archaeon]MCI4358943.1 hypothetical protein [Thermoplasmata archaeon]
MAFILSILAGVLMIIDGAFLSIAGGVVSSAGYADAGALLGGLGFLGGFFGFIVVVLSILLFISPDSHVGYGIAILLLSLLSIVGGGGFIIGLILGVIGGIVAIVFVPEDGAGRPLPREVPGTARRRFCAFCELPIPPKTATCANCGRIAD